MEEKKSGISGILTIVIGVVLVARIAMIASRSNTGSSTVDGWNNWYLLWSVFVLVAVVGYYFWSKQKKEE